jgi:glycolate oxidase FAD binding subunit
MQASLAPEIGTRCQQLLGATHVFGDLATLARYAIDGVTPRIVVRPGSAEEIAALIRLANEQNWSVVPFGGGTRQDVGRVSESIDVVLTTERLNKIEKYDPGDLTISLQAGIRVSDVTGVCGEHRQLLPIEAPAGATIGGALASAESGPLRAQFGAARDFCIGISFITGDGLRGRGGGNVVKNVAGYDLMKLMIGSYGSLGVIVSANFKLFPQPQQTMTCICEFPSLSEAMKLRDWLLSSPLTPLAAEILSPSALEYLNDSSPRDPDVWAPESKTLAAKPQWQLVIRFAGSDRVLARCRKELSSYTTRELTSSEEAGFWTGVATFEQRVIERNRNAMVFQLHVPIAESHAAIDAAQIAATGYNFVMAVLGRATVGSYIIAFLPLAIDPPAATQFAGAALDFRARLSKASSAVVTRCPLEAKQHFNVWGSTPTDTLLMQKIKRALDPNGILNRGRFLAG